MSSIEILFSAGMVLLPITAFLFKRFTKLFLLMVIGANPYVTAAALLSTLLLKFKLIFGSKINKSLLLLAIAWLSYGLMIGLSNFTGTFVSEFIQLGISLLWTFYLYQAINSASHFKDILKQLMLSGAVLSVFEILIFVLGIEIDTNSFIGTIASNYGSFYLVISTILIPLYFFKTESKLYGLIAVLGYFAIQINESRAMMLLGILFIVLTFVSLRNRYMRLIAIGLLVLGGTYIFITFDPGSMYRSGSLFSVLNFETNFSNLERLRLIIYSVNLFLDNLYGYGLGSSYEIYYNNPVTVLNVYPHPHNTLTFMMVELGVAGIFLYIAFFLTMISSIRKITPPAIKALMSNICLGLFFYSIVEVLFYNGVLTLLVFMFYALVICAQKIDFESEAHD